MQFYQLSISDVKCYLPIIWNISVVSLTALDIVTNCCGTILKTFFWFSCVYYCIISALILGWCYIVLLSHNLIDVCFRIVCFFTNVCCIADGMVSYWICNMRNTDLRLLSYVWMVFHLSRCGIAFGGHFWFVCVVCVRVVIKQHYHLTFLQDHVSSFTNFISTSCRMRCQYLVWRSMIVR